MAIVSLHKIEYEAIKNLPSEEFVIITKAIYNYGFDKTEPTNLTSNLQIAFNFIKVRLDHDHKRRENGKKGGRPRVKLESYTIPLRQVD